MSTTLVFNAQGISEYSSTLLADGEDCFSRLYRYAMDVSADRVLVLASHESLPQYDGWIYDSQSLSSTAELMRVLHDYCADDRNIIYTWFDQPFLSAALTRQLLAIHQDNICEYTFADGYPIGMTPEILHTSIIPILRQLLEKKDEALDRGSLFRIIERDINAFDIETEMSTVDYRLLRIELCTDTRRNFLICRNIAEAIQASATPESSAATHTDTERILDVLQERRELLRVLPSYVRLQLTNYSRSWAQYEPFANQSAEHVMDYEKYCQFIANLKAFSPNAILSLGYAGELAEHPSITDCIRSAQDLDIELYIETSGVGWSKEHTGWLCSELGPRSSVIVSLDAANEAAYKELRSEYFSEARSFAHRLMDAGLMVYVEATRLAGKEHLCEEFYHYWKEHTDKIIIKKYNHFCGRLDDRKTVDLSPLKRFPCWHSEREISILLDGTAPLCDQDLDRGYVLGNVFTEGLETVWQAGEQYYHQHISQSYPELCKNCDEYYVFNA